MPEDTTLRRLAHEAVVPGPSTAAPAPSSGAVRSASRARPAKDEPLIAALGHLAAWAGLYVAASVACFAQLEGARVDALALAYAWSTANAVYLLDRLKVRGPWMDPADRLAHPRRYAFLERHSAAARGLMLGLWGLSLVLAWLVHPLLILATAGAAAGVLAYAGLPRRGPGARRLKDIFVLKNLFVAGGIAGFALVVVRLAGAGRGREGWIPLTWGAWLLPGLAWSHLVGRVFADAVLCDIDDENADRAHATETLPTRMGGDAAWRIALWLRLALAASLLAWPVGPWRARLAWAVVTVVSSVGLRVWRPARVRDPVDGRFVLEAAAAWLVTRG